MSIRKQRHVCERCGFEWHERVSGIHDELFEWIHHGSEREAEAKQARREIARLKLHVFHLQQLVEACDTLAQNFEALAEHWRKEAERVESCV